MTTRTPEQALAWTQQRGAIPGGAGWCKRETRTAYNVPSDGSNDATEAWSRTKRRHSTATVPPRGAIVWWTGGRNGHGHVAISQGGGFIRSTDLPISGRWGTAKLSDPERLWGLRYVGWSEDIEGVRVFTPPRKPSRIAQLRGRLQDVARTAPTKRRRAAAAAAAAALRGFK